MPDNYKGRCSKQSILLKVVQKLIILPNYRNLTALLSNPSPTITGWGATFVGGGTVSRFLMIRMKMIVMMLMMTMIRLLLLVMMMMMMTPG